MAAEAARRSPGGGAGGLNICAWQSWLPLAIQTRSQPMNFTVLLPTSPPRRRSKLLPLSSGVSSAANDQSGSGGRGDDEDLHPVARRRAVRVAEVGPLVGHCRDLREAGGGALSGPVTESNGLRDRIGSALVACGVADAGAAGRRAMSGGAASCFSSAPRLAPTMCMIPCASKNAAIATSDDDHGPEVAFEELVEGHAMRGEY